MRRGEVLPSGLGENTNSEPPAADTNPRDRRLGGTVHSGDAGNREAARFVRRRGSNSGNMTPRDCPYRNSTRSVHQVNRRTANRHRQRERPQRKTANCEP